MLLIAAGRAFTDSSDGLLRRPKVNPASAPLRISTQQAVNQLRAEVWGRGLGIDHFGFASGLLADEAGEMHLPAGIRQWLIWKRPKSRRRTESVAYFMTATKARA